MGKNINYSYDPESDELNINVGKVKNSISYEIDDEVYVKLHPKTKTVVGFTILHFEERFKHRKEGKYFSLPLIGEFKLPSNLAL